MPPKKRQAAASAGARAPTSKAVSSSSKRVVPTAQTQSKEPKARSSNTDPSQKSKASKYVRLDQREHVLLRPNTYVGSTKCEAWMGWLFDEVKRRMVYREVRYVPGLLQIFDEILVNAIDHSVRLKEEKHAELKRKRVARNGPKGAGGAVGAGGAGGGGGAEEEDDDDDDGGSSSVSEAPDRKKKAGGGNDKPKTVQTMKNIHVLVDRETGHIEIMNDGEGIDVDVHVEDDGRKKTYIPELIFGNMLTSANYDDEQMVSDDDEEDEAGKSAGTGAGANGQGGQGGQKQKKTKKKRRVIGGQNGVGAKACNILSKEFEVETVDRRRRLRYRQLFKENMSCVEPPVIEKCPPRTAPYTRIRFLPDYARFGMGCMTQDMYDVFVKRVLDATAVSDPEVTVHLNGQKVDCKSFERYIDLYLGPPSGSKSAAGGGTVGAGEGGGTEDAGAGSGMDAGSGSGEESDRVYEKVNDWWEVAAACSDGNGLQQVSFVNGLWTIKGGTHVQHVSNQIVRKLTEMIANKRGNKDVVANLKPQFIRDNLFLFVKAIVPNPEFDSQTKDELKTPASAFDAPGGKVELSKSFIEKLYKTAIVKRVMSLNEALVDKSLKKTDGKKQGSIYGITKLDDANWAGGPKSHLCTLILTEGDSAKTMAMGGLDQEARDRYGVFPLRGKVMNVCNKQAQHIMANVEIQHLKTILGLESGRKYDEPGALQSLRYGQIMIMTDQDCDGSHIKGLLFNLFHQMWPSLLRVDGFFTSMLTPIVKATKRTPGRGQGVTLSFYNLADYHDWMSKNEQGKGYDIKYYKGLGTSTRAEAKQYFRELKMAHYRWTGHDSDDVLSLAFDKNRADDRKRWLMTYDKRQGLDFGLPEVTFPDFVNKDLIHFSNYDVVRSIPSVCDGLKPSQRKIVYASFKRNLVNQIKVAQLAGYVSEKAAYHHGEDSLNSTIVGLAQDFVGANNINLLQPVGQFGSRTCGGKDSSAARYIFTCFNPLTPMLYMREDEGFLNYLDDDGYPVEPEHYVPILPMVLVNGVTGIGTGFSSDVPSYNPEDLVNVVRQCLDSACPSEVDVAQLYPWVRGFKGTIEKLSVPTADGAGLQQTEGGGERSGERGGEDRSEKGERGGERGERFYSRGVFVRTKPNEVRVEELPVGYWTSDFKEHVDRLKQERPNMGIKAIKHNHTDISVQCDITFNTPQALDALMQVVPANATRPEMTQLEKELKLVATRNLSTTNMHLYNREGRIQKYESVRDIILEHFALRMEAYMKRKVLLLEDLRARQALLADKIRFLQLVIDGTIVVQKRSKAELEEQLQQLGFLPRSTNAAASGGKTSGNDGDEDSAADSSAAKTAAAAAQQQGGFDHLIKMPIFTLTLDKKRELEAQLEDTEARIATTEATSEKDMWKKDLDAFVQAYRRWIVETAPEDEPIVSAAPHTPAGKGAKGGGNGAKGEGSSKGGGAKGGTGNTKEGGAKGASSVSLSKGKKNPPSSAAGAGGERAKKQRKQT